MTQTVGSITFPCNVRTIAWDADQGILPNTEEYFTSKQKIIGLTGYARSGKDTVGDMLVENFNFVKLSFAEALRQGLYAINPIVTIEYEQERQSFWEWLSGEPSRINIRTLYLQDVIDDIGWEAAKVKYPEIRRLMQKYGTEGGRDIHGQDCWTNIVKRQIEENWDTNIVITDVRFPNEVALVESLGGHVIRVSAEKRGVRPANEHSSEQVLENIKHEIKNDSSIEDLKDCVFMMQSLLS